MRPIKEYKLYKAPRVTWGSSRPKIDNDVNNINEVSNTKNWRILAAKCDFVNLNKMLDTDPKVNTA